MSPQRDLGNAPFPQYDRAGRAGRRRAVTRQFRPASAFPQLVEETDERGKKKPPKQIFPRFHQLDVVRKLLADAEAFGAGRRYLIQHSAGSGNGRRREPGSEFALVRDKIIYGQMLTSCSP